MSNHPSRSKKTKTIRVSEFAHDQVSQYIIEQGEDIKIGKFFEKAGLEKLTRLQNSNSSFSLLSTSVLLSNGWKKQGNNYKKGDDTIRYMGTYWLYNGETTLTEQNYLEKIK